MKLLLNIIVTFFLLFWPMVLMTSPMMFDAPGSDNRRQAVLTVSLVLCYPIFIFLFYWLFGLDFYGIAAKNMLIGSIVVVGLALFTFGYGKMLFNSMRGIANSGYSVAEGQVYFNAMPIDADADTFEAIGDADSLYVTYFRDQQRVYYDGKPLPVNNPADFRQIGEHQDYWTDGVQVFMGERLLEGVTLQGLEIHENFMGQEYATWRGESGSKVLVNGKSLPSADADTFRMLNGHIGKDKQRIYYSEMQILAEADAETFELFTDDHYLGRDKQAVYDVIYKESGRIVDADVDTFESLGRGYMKDANCVYYREQFDPTQVLEGADAATFEVTGWIEATDSDAKDANHLYMDGKRVVAKGKH